MYPIVSERVRGGYARADECVVGEGGIPASRVRLLPPDLFLPRGKQICRSIIDSVYDWNHLHDVCRVRTREKKSARILILSQSSSLLLPRSVRACISRGLSSLLFSLSLTSSPPLQPS